MKRCISCNNIATELHHVIRKSRGGTNNPENLMPICRDCHNLLHFSSNTEVRNRIINISYEYIKPNLDKCWSAKIKPKIIRELESEKNK